MVIDHMFLYYFVGPARRIEILFEKDGTPENGGVDFEMGDIRTLHTCIGGWRKFHGEPVCFFIAFWGQKEKFLKALLICTFIPWLLNSFDLPSYRSELRKRYTLRLLLMCLETLGAFLEETGRVLLGDYDL